MKTSMRTKRNQASSIALSVDNDEDDNIFFAKMEEEQQEDLERRRSREREKLRERRRRTTMTVATLVLPESETCIALQEVPRRTAAAITEITGNGPSNRQFDQVLREHCQQAQFALKLEEFLPHKPDSFLPWPPLDRTLSPMDELWENVQDYVVSRDEFKKFARSVGVEVLDSPSVLNSPAAISDESIKSTVALPDPSDGLTASINVTMQRKTPRSKKTTEEKELGKRERENLWTIIVAVAQEAKFDLEHPYKAGELIEKLTEQLGRRIDDKTIALHLEKAYAFIKDIEK